MTDHNYETVLYTIDGKVAIITLNRPEQLNAWTMQMGAELKHAIESAENNKAVVGIVITGAGRAFCAGADMADLQSLTGEGGVEGMLGKSLIASNPGDDTMPAAFRQTYSYLASIQKPIIAAVNGAVAGMALPIILFCDMRFFAESGFVMSAFPQRGLVAEYGSSWMLPRIVGVDVAFDILMSSRKVYGPEAKELKLATRVYADDDLLAEAVAYMQHLGDNCAPQSLRAIKGQVYRDLFRDPVDAFAEAEKLMLATFGSDDMKEGVMAFLEKRKPAFTPVGNS